MSILVIYDSQRGFDSFIRDLLNIQYISFFSLMWLMVVNRKRKERMDGQSGIRAN